MNGFVRNGIDSSTLINLAAVFDSEYEEFKDRGFTFPPNLFFYHEISRSEVIGVLIHNFKFTKEEAIAAFEKLVTTFNLEKIGFNKEIDKQYQKIVEEANGQVVNKTQNQSLKIGLQDIIIIAGFLRAKVNVVHSGDQGFLKTCEVLGLNLIPLQEQDIQKEKVLKAWMKKRKN